MSDKTLGLQLHGFLQKQQNPPENGDKSNGAETPAAIKEDNIMSEQFDTFMKEQKKVNVQQEQRFAQILDALNRQPQAAAPHNQSPQEAYMAKMWEEFSKSEAKKAADKVRDESIEKSIKDFNALSASAEKQGINLRRYEGALAASLMGLPVQPVDTETTWVKASNAAAVAVGATIGVALVATAFIGGMALTQAWGGASLPAAT